MNNDVFEPLSYAETENLCDASDYDNEKLKSEIDELKAEIQDLTKKNQRLQKSVEKKQITERSYNYLKKSFVKYIEESQETIRNLSTSLDRAERYVRDVEESAQKIKWKTFNVDDRINQLFRSVNDMFETLSLFGIKNGKWSYHDWLRANVPDAEGNIEESDFASLNISQLVSNAVSPKDNCISGASVDTPPAFEADFSSEENCASDDASTVMEDADQSSDDDIEVATFRFYS